MADFSEILEQALTICSRAAKDINFLNPEENEDDVYLTRESYKNDDILEWHDKYRKIPPEKANFKLICNKSDLVTLANLRVSHVVIQVDFRMMPTTVKEKTSAAYFPFLLIITNKENGRIEGFKIIPPLPDYDSMLADIPRLVVKQILNLRYKPALIELKNPLLFEMLNSILPEAGIKILPMKSLSACDNAFNNLIQNING